VCFGKLHAATWSPTPICVAAFFMLEIGPEIYREKYKPKLMVNITEMIILDIDTKEELLMAVFTAFSRFADSPTSLEITLSMALNNLSDSI